MNAGFLNHQLYYSLGVAPLSVTVTFSTITMTLRVFFAEKHWKLHDLQGGFQGFYLRNLFPSLNRLRLTIEPQVAIPGVTYVFTRLLGSKECQCIYGGFLKQDYPKMDGLQWKTLLKWMIWVYPYFRKHLYTHHQDKSYKF